ncbi:MAG TPA: hypothetical protein VNJ01_03395 [Bacteriovoracaceae bacterium]|nr:hypothetical protein [Bacteriovoracaceae bacterium]
MIDNNNSSFGNSESESDTNLPRTEANASNTESKLKDYGKKSLAPLIDLVSKYKGDINPYFSAIGRGLQGAVSALDGNSSSESMNSSINTSSSKTSSASSSVGSEVGSEADQIVAGWFRDASGWFTGAQEKIASGNAKELLNYLEAEAAKSPGLMFSTSYVVGLFVGRMGRHLGRQKMTDSSSAAPFQNDSSLNDLH